MLKINRQGIKKRGLTAHFLFCPVFEAMTISESLLEEAIKAYKFFSSLFGVVIYIDFVKWGF